MPCRGDSRWRHRNSTGIKGWTRKKVATKQLLLPSRKLAAPNIKRHGHPSSPPLHRFSGRHHGQRTRATCGACLAGIGLATGIQDTSRLQRRRTLLWRLLGEHRANGEWSGFRKLIKVAAALFPQTQWKNQGQCGVCGDSFAQPKPRSHELFGAFVAKPPVVTATYSRGQTVDVQVELTANHGGFFVFQLCSADTQQPGLEVSEQCLEENTLTIVNQGQSTPATAVDGAQISDHPIDGTSVVDEGGDESSDSSASHPASDRQQVDLKKNIRTVKNKYNEDRYNYEHVQADVESANAQVIDARPGAPKTGNRFNPVLRDVSLEAYKFRIPFERARVYTVQVRLPQDLTCKRCVLRWVYVAGNSWGVCDRTGYRGAVGCGPQEEFRNCADIRID